MTHCALVTVYKDIGSVNSLIQSLPKDWDVYVHIDKKSRVRVEDIDERANTIKEKRIYWGAWEHLYVFVRLMKLAKESGVEYDYYHLLSGQDCIVLSSFEQVNELLCDGYCFLNCTALPRESSWWEGGYKIFKYRTLSSFCDVRKGFYRALNKILYLFQKFFRLTRPLPDCPLYSGSVYCSLQGSFVDWFLQDKWSQKLLNNLRNTTCAEEVFFQTVIMNSPYKDKVHNGNLRYVDWSTIPAPKYLDESDYDKILKSGCLFCRKVESDVSRLLIKKLLSQR